MSLAPTPYAHHDGHWPAVPHPRPTSWRPAFVVDAYRRPLWSPKLLRCLAMLGFCAACWGGAAAIVWWAL